VKFEEIAADALEYSKSHNISFEDDGIRMKAILHSLGVRWASDRRDQATGHRALAQPANEEGQGRRRGFETGNAQSLSRHAASYI
jgi:hypothetical protein